ncbi:hypothetical protein KUTeg_014172 [Tegillarca granosa]|uniref:Tyr recombinase domain-containing protein n=1 Tax=Tegillarca granosa TaxID=220873 RepID=A0ABQ9F1A1_TEGGR|nr:hypothetical protein KUTeg_014172 [Tegillarca granosa]
MEWLGFIWNLETSVLEVPSDKIQKIVQLVVTMISNKHATARQIACIVEFGKSFSTSHWKTLNEYKDHENLGLSASLLPKIVRRARSESTNKKYDSYFLKFEKWCILNSFMSLPASVPAVSLFICGLIQQGVSYAVLESYFYSINWFHKISLNSNPCEDNLLKLVMEGGKRILGKPIMKKEPVTVDILNKLVDHFGKDENNLINLRTCVLCLLGFSGFLRYNELANIKMSDLFFEQGYVKISIRESKTDTYRRGNEIIIAKTGNKLCPVSWLNKYILKAGLSKDSSEYLFTAINYSSKSDTYKATNKNKGLSYTRAREIFLSSLKTLALDPKKYCLHSLRSGGASAAANNQVPDRLIKAHGRWVTDIAKDGYIKDDLPNKILVSLNLGL